METLFVAKDAKLERRESTLLVKTAQGVVRVPIAGLKNVVIAGEAGLTSALLSLLAKEDIRVTVLDWYGNVSGSFEPAGSPSSGYVRLAQARHALDPTKRLALAKEFVLGSVRNMRANLRYRVYRGNDDLVPHVEKLKNAESALQSARDVETLMGHEGNARASYFDSWGLIDKRLMFGKRVRRPPNNPINCLISWLNGLTYTLARNEIAKTHLDGSISFLHSPYEVRHSLALDLSEPFKPAIVDPIIFELILRDMLRDSWFAQDENVCRLTEEGRRALLEVWISKVEQGNADKPSFRTLVRNDALAIERHVLNCEFYKSFVRRV